MSTIGKLLVAVMLVSTMLLPAAAQEIDLAVHPWTGAPTDYIPLMDMIGEAPVVAIGEASHGTHEFYATRAAITQHLIEEKGFKAVMIEGDFPAARLVDEYVRGADMTPEAALAGFEGRFPQWMWRNEDVLAFITWLRQYNDALPAGESKVGFYGLDLYSLYESQTEVLDYLEETDPAAAEQAREHYACFASYGEEIAYAYGVSGDIDNSCADESAASLGMVQSMGLSGSASAEAHFYAEQNARVVANAEAYYRRMFEGSSVTWNLRDTHMADTVEAVRNFLGEGQNQVVIWAHNSHVGDQSATEMAQYGQTNIGELLRDRYGAENVRLIGFSTYTGTVTAADNWDEEAECKLVNPGLPQSYEDLFHNVEGDDFLLILRGQDNPALQEERLQRAIGVIYRPETERQSHYFYANVPEQFDALIHLDATSRLVPLDEVPECPDDGV